MATWDAADLLQRVQDLAGRPTNDSFFTSAYWYRRLTEAEQEWKPIVAVHYPAEMWVGPYLMEANSDASIFSFQPFPLFKTIDSDWSGTDWTVASDTMTAAASSSAISFTPTVPLVKGLTYRVRATVTVTSGTLTPGVGGTSGTAISASESLDEEIVCGTGTTLTFTGSSFTGTVTDLEVDFAENPLKLLFTEATTGDVLKAGQFTDTTADYVLEDGQIRVTGGRTRTFVDGAPYVRLIPPAGVITASYDSTIHPKRARILLVYKALALAAYRTGGLGDPGRFEDLMDERWFGNPEKGKIGLQGELRAADHYGGLVGVMQNRPYAWWRPNG